MTCKGCGKEVELLSRAGFCDAGICQFREEGYTIRARENLVPIDQLRTANHKAAWEKLKVWP
jgi:hypothetical protein